MEINIQTVGMTYPNGKQALKGLSLDLRSPSLVGLLGPNGAGKSTLMKLLVAALLPTTGSILVDGQPLTRVERQLKARLGYLPQDFGLFDELTVEQFLDYMAALKGLRGPRAVIRQVIRSVNLEEKARAKIRTLSGGQRQRVLLARALISRPEVMLLDEPTSGMDLQSGENFYRLLAGLNRDHGLTILMVSHDVDRICSYVSTLYCLEEGTLAELTPGQVRRERAGLHRHSDMTRERRGERSVHL